MHFRSTRAQSSKRKARVCQSAMVAICMLNFLPTPVFSQIAHNQESAQHIATITGMRPTPYLAIESTNEWVLLPNWLAGSWQATSQIVLEGYDFRQHRKVVDSPVRIPVRRVSVLGTQCDRYGRVWHYLGTPYEKRIDASSFWERHVIERATLTCRDPGQVAVTTLATVQKLDSKNGDLLDIFFERTLTTYVPLSDQLLQVSYVVEDYDLQGRPTFTKKMISTQKLIERFSPIDQDERGNLKAKFQEFLQRNALQDLLSH